MKKWGSIEMGSVATVSTAHIPQQHMDLLGAVLDDRSRTIEDPDHWINDIVWASHPYGWLMTTPSLIRRSQEKDKDTPNFLIEAAQLANDLNLAWIVYDQDGDVVEGLTNYHE